MTIPTGHKTITYKDGGAAWQAARTGDTYIDKAGRHWECRGTFTKPTPSTFTPKPIYGETRHCVGVQAQNLEPAENSWKSERGIPADVSVKYETSYTKTVVDGLIALGAYRNAFPGMHAAIDLLKDYHSSLHAPYEQRDKARRDLVVAEAQLAQARDALTTLKRRFRIRFKHLAGRFGRWTTDLE